MSEIDWEFRKEQEEWLLEDGCRLVYRENPNIEVRLEDTRSRLPWAKLYRRARRAIKEGTLQTVMYVPYLDRPALIQVEPKVFLAWVREQGIPIPPELDDIAPCPAAVSEAGLAGRIAEAAQEGGSLRERVAAVQGAPLKAKPLPTKERQSALKLIIGMAVKGYQYDPAAVRNDATGKISSDLESLGIGLDADTVRKWLREAAELLPQNPRRPDPLH